MYYKMNIAGLERDLPLCKINDELYIAAIIMFGDVAITEATARDLLAKAPEFDIIITAESKDDSLYVLFHSENSEKLHNRLLLKVAEKILPHLQCMLRLAKDKGEISIDDPENAAIIGLYGEIGVLLAPHLTDKQRIEAIQTGWKRLLCL